MLNKISDEWKDNLVNDVHTKSRFYANIRGVEYPAISGTPTYTAPIDHRSSGSVNLTSGILKYLVTLTQPFTIDCRIAPTSVASHDFIQFHETESDYTKRLKLFSVVNSGTGHYYACDWNESSSQIVSTNGFGTIVANDYIRLTFVFNNGTSYLYRNGALVSSGSTSAILTNKNWMTVDATNTIVDYIRIIPNFAAPAADVVNNFEDVYNEEIYFQYNDQSTGVTRCQITKYVNAYNVDLPGEFRSTQAGISLNNISGEFSADQYAAFSPENGSYNGTAAQSYLSRKIPIWIESWQDNKIQDVPDGLVGYWSMDDVPEIPDNPAGTTYLWDKSTTDGFVSDFTPAPSVSSGLLTFKGDAYRWPSAVTAGTKFVVRFKTDKDTEVRLTSGNPNPLGQYSIASKNVKAGEWTTLCGTLATGATFYAIASVRTDGTNSEAVFTISDWYIGDGSYSTPLLDNSGTGRHGTIYGATPVDGVSSKALSFDGISSYTYHTVPQPDEFSISMWLKPNDLTSSGVLFAWGEYNSNGIYIQSDPGASGEIIIHFGRSGGDEYLFENILLSEFFNFIITVNRTTKYYSIYRNGILVKDGYLNYVFDLNTGGILSFGSYNGSAFFWNGIIDEPRIYNRAISASEVLQLYNQTKYRYNQAQEPYFETIFQGNIAANSFARSTNVGDFSRISVQADSIIADIAKRVFRTGRKYEDYYLARTTDTGTSLFHELVKLGTQKEVYNYATNASFENTTIGNSWAGTISRDNTRAFVGTYAGYVNSATTVKTTIVTELTKYERFTFSVWAYSASAVSITMQIRDMLGATPNGSTTSVNSHGGKGWQLLTVTHDVVSSSSDRLECSIITTGTPSIWLDAACLNYGDYKPLIALNTNDGTSAVSQRADGVLTAYQICGAIGDDVSYQHPWAIIPKDANAWEKLKQLAEASIARHLYVTPDGIIKLVTANTAPASTLGDISDIASVAAATQAEQANKLKVSGVKIVEKSDIRVWNLNDSNALAGDTGAPSGSYQRTTGAGDYFPLLTEAPDGLECAYDKEAIGG